MRNRAPGARRLIDRDRLRGRRPRLELLEERQLLATFTVSNTNDSGGGSLRQAIIDANTSLNVGGPDLIVFNVPGSGFKSFVPNSPLPSLDEAVVVDGYSQPGAQASTAPDGSNAKIFVQINGGNLSGANAVGLVINAPNVTIDGLNLSGFGQAAITDTAKGGGALISGNYIGTTPAGNAPNNNNVGIALQTGGNIIGDGKSVATRNLISGNLTGVSLSGAASSANLIAGNLIGCDASGLTALRNTDGIIISGGSSNNTIGGLAATARNVITSNVAGVRILNDNSSGNLVIGNYIGIDAAGVNPLGNSIGAFVSAPGNTIGGGSLASRNIISGNTNAGVQITNAFSANASGNVVSGNFIGVNVTGALSVGNTEGVLILGAPGNTIGGAAGSLANLISGNKDVGVSISGASATGNVVLGNQIGTNLAGSAVIPNASAGVAITDGTANTIGGSVGAARNIISGNGGSGVLIAGTTAANLGNVIAGNLIGVDSSGTIPLPNTVHGVVLAASGNVVGGQTAGTGNLISGNVVDGVHVEGNGIGGNLIAGNLIGVNSTGSAALSNAGFGVNVTAGQGTSIGGSVGAARNVISGNSLGGVVIQGGAISSGALVSGNLIGTDRTGAIGIGNGSGIGVKVIGTPGATIGGNSAAAGNVVSGHTNNVGIYIIGAGAANELIAGNRVGTNALGTAALPNLEGISLNALNSTIGGVVAGAGNLASGNSAVGIDLNAAQSAGSGNIVVGNIVGLASDGKTALGNGQVGVNIGNASNNTIGGSTAGARNVISGNGQGGLVMAGSSLTGILIAGNYFGTDSTGSTKVDSLNVGIDIVSGSGNTIGGPTSAYRNVIAGVSAGAAVVLLESTAPNNVVASNFIGTNAAGNASLGNAPDGILVRGSGNTIGGPSGAGNLISGNGGAGINLQATATNTLIEGNTIGTNLNGTAALGNGTSGIIVRATGVTVGGTTADTANAISGNAVDGIQFLGTGNFNGLVQSNNIGTDFSGANSLGNGLWGISIEGPNGVSVGGSTAAGFNLIAFNGTVTGTTTGGIGITSGTGNLIRFNEIGPNKGLGIDLGEDGPTPNTPGIHNSGPNLLQNFPVLSSALSGPASTAITGILDGSPNTTYTIQFFLSDTADPTGFGEGELYIGSATVTTDGTGLATFDGSNATVPVHVNSGQVVTSIAIDPAGNTSEFSQAVTAQNAATDLAISITASPEPVQVGQPLTYTITVTNNGPNPASNVTVQDTVPPGFVFVPGSNLPAATTSFNTVTNTFTALLGTLAANSSATVKFSVTPSSPGSFQDSATVTSTEGDTDGSNNTDTVTSTVIPAADLDLSLTAAPSPVLLGQNLTYTLTVKNKGPSGSTGVVAIDNLPANVSFVSATPSQGTFVRNGSQVTASFGSLAANATATLVIVVKPTATGSITDTASVSATETDPVGTNNNASVTTQVRPSADLSVGITASPTPGLVGQPYTYTVTVTNNGLSDAAGVSILDTLPTSVTFVSASASSGGTVTPGAGTVTASFPTLISGATATLTIVVTPNSTGSITDTASVSSASTPDPILTNNTASLTTTISPTADLSVTVSDAPDPVSVGQTLTYLVTVTNLGPNAATGVIATDTLPAGVTFISVAQSQGTFSASAGTVTLNFGNLAKNGVATASISVKPTTSAATSIQDKVSVTANEVDPTPVNNTATTTTTVNPSADVSLSMTGSPNPVLVGTNLTYVITVNNAGPSDATNVIVSDTLPSGVNLVSVTPSQGTFSTIGNVITASLGSIVGTNGVATVTIVVSPTPAASVNITNTASVLSDTPDPVSTNNSASVTTRVNPAADLVVTATDSPDPLLIGGDLTYTIKVLNNGPSDATGVTLVDTFPTGAIYQSSTLPSGATIAVNNGVAQITVGSILAGVQKTITLVVRPTTTGTISNTAAATAAQSDPTPADATVTTTTTVDPAADVLVSMPPLPNAVLIGQPVTFTANVVNNGPSSSAGVVATVNLQAGLTIISQKATLGSVSVSGNTVTISIPTLANGAISTVTIVAIPPVIGAVFANASVQSSVLDPDSKNNTASTSATVIAASDLSITETASANPAPLHADLTFTLVVTNNGPSTATNVVLTDTIPSAATFISATALDGTSFTPDGQVLTIPLGSLVVGQTETISIVVRPSEMGTLNNTASVGGDQADTAALNSTNVQLIVVSGVPGAFQFSQPNFTVAENAGSATITVNRVGGADGPTSVNVTTFDGTAVAGVNYTTTSTNLFFADGQMSQTFTIPILDDGKNTGNKTVLLSLTNPVGGASLGTTPNATLTIQESDSGPVIVPPTAAPLQVTSLKRFGFHDQPTQLVLTFSGPLDPTSAQNPANYTVVSAGRDGRYGTADDVVTRVQSASYNATASTVTLMMANRLDVHKSFRLTVNGTSTSGLTSPAGVLLDGNGDGKAGGDYVAIINLSTLAGPVPSSATPTVSRHKLATRSVKPGTARVTTRWADHLKHRPGSH